MPQYTPNAPVPQTLPSVTDPFRAASAGIALGREAAGLYKDWKGGREVAKLLSKTGEWTLDDYRSLARYNPDLAETLQNLHTTQRSMEREDQDHFLKFVNFGADWAGQLAHGAMMIEDPERREAFFVEGVNDLMRDEALRPFGAEILKRVMHPNGDPDLSDETLTALIATARGIEINARMSIADGNRKARKNRWDADRKARDERSRLDRESRERIAANRPGSRASAGNRAAEIQAYADQHGISFEQAGARLYPNQYAFEDQSLEGTGARKTLSGEDYQASDAPPPLPAAGDPANILRRLNPQNGDGGESRDPSAPPPEHGAAPVAPAAPPAPEGAEPRRNWREMFSNLLPDISLPDISLSIGPPADTNNPPPGPTPQQPPSAPSAGPAPTPEAPLTPVPPSTNAPPGPDPRGIRHEQQLLHQPLPTRDLPPEQKSQARKDNAARLKGIREDFHEFPRKYAQMILDGDAYVDMYQPLGKGWGVVEFWLKHKDGHQLHQLKWRDEEIEKMFKPPEPE